ncbi:glycosyltransferase family 2 protein [Rubrobacter radiotolerans]|uniref:Glycosyltransferase family 2 protein n=1 Tax=Rubrobacter radiotolerans TaxID=42256 RepID=A0AB35T632_RUBRA|nr:glycosyltransferase family 2 protein [Rubrobacter radiotolerans]MDX5893191.1 glycosyltransferase family 2 protein [Rubrobacter radiotolerans]
MGRRLVLEHVRFAGVVAAALIAVYAVIKYRLYGGWRRFDLLLALAIALAIATVSFVPQVGNVFLGLFDLQNRGFALLVVSNLALFGLFLYLLNQLRQNGLKNGRLVSGLAIREYRERFGLRKKADGRADGSERRLLVLVPAYNEAPTILQVLRTLPESVLGYRVDVLVVDDGSTDGTEEILLSAGYPVAVHAVNRGQGDALRTGFEIACLEGADIVVNFDADGQYRAEDLEDLIRPVVEGEADYVHGSRFLGFYEEAGSVRHLGVVFFSRLISLLSGQRITDATNGFRAIRGSEVAKLDLREESFSATELILEALRNDLRLVEVPVSMLKRAEGESKKPKRLRYPLGVLRVIIQTWLR